MCERGRDARRGRKGSEAMEEGGSYTRLCVKREGERERGGQFDSPAWSKFIH